MINSLFRRANRDGSPSTTIEYALIAAGLSIAILVLVGEVGGMEEQLAAAYIGTHMAKPVVAYVAGLTAPKGRRMGHAGAIISGSSGTAAGKYRKLEAAGVATVRSPAEIGSCLRELMTKRA